MEIIDKICEVWGRTLSPIETQKIITLSQHFSEDILLEACKLSVGKTHPMQYMARILYYVEHPLDNIPKPKPKEKTKEEIMNEQLLNDSWLKEFNERNGYK